MSSIRYLDAVSGLLSFIGLIITFFDIKDVIVAMWENNMIFSTDVDFIQASDLLGDALYDTCSPNAISNPDKIGGSPYKLFYMKQTWGNNTFYGTCVPVDTNRSYKPWVMLHWILVCSIIFPAARCWFFTDLKNANQEVLFQYVPGGGPDFWRWVEYAVTSPLQIIIIAGSFFMRETVMLTLIAVVQGALMLLGYVIELEIQGLNAIKVAASYHQVPEQSKIYPRTFTATCRLLFLLVCAYVCHGVVWSVLIMKFQMQASAGTDCKNPTEMPPEILILIALECFLFSVFGVVISVQALRVVLADTLTEEAVEHQWTNVSVWYSGLSVSAKLVLEWGFLALLADDW